MYVQLLIDICTGELWRPDCGTKMRSHWVQQTLFKKRPNKLHEMTNRDYPYRNTFREGWCNECVSFYIMTLYMEMLTLLLFFDRNRSVFGWFLSERIGNALNRLALFHGSGRYDVTVKPCDVSQTMGPAGKCHNSPLLATKIINN